MALVLRRAVRIRWSKALSAASPLRPSRSRSACRARSCVAGGEHAGHRGLAAVVDHDLAARRQLDRTGALQPLGVRQQADLDEDALELDVAPRRAVGVGRPVTFSPSPSTSVVSAE
jgi:hypothetical protein